MTGEEQIRDRARRVAEAAAWRTQLTEVGAETTPDFEAWLAEEGNARIWAETNGPWDFFAEHANDPVAVAARQAALGDARRASAALERPREWRRLAATLAGVAVIAAAVWGAVWWANRPLDYATVIGERRVIALADGSRISLDSNSEVTVRYTHASRELHLLRGQARFDVAHDVLRPFSVLAGDQKVVATGTAFNVDIAGDKVLVTLIEGHVVIVDTSRAPSVTALPPPKLVELHAGQQMAALPKTLPKVAVVNVERVTAWTSGQLMFDNEALGEVVAEINRYTETPIQIADRRTASLRISGIFNTGDIPTFVAIVTHYLPVDAATSDDGTIVLRQRS